MVDYIRFSIVAELDTTHYLTMMWCLGPPINPDIREYTADIECMRVFAVLKKYTEREILYDEPMNNPYVPNMDCPLYQYWESEITLTSFQSHPYRHIDCETEMNDIICENDSSYIVNWESVLTNIANLSKAKADNECSSSPYFGISQQYHEIICGFVDVLRNATTHNV